MAAINYLNTLDLSTSGSISILLASKECLQPGGLFDLAKSFAFDLNLTSANAAGELQVFLQNDDGTTSTFISKPNTKFTIATGTYPDGQTKETIDSNGVIKTKYCFIKWVRSSGTGTLQIDGQIEY